MNVDFGILARAPDVGQSVMSGFERGQQMGMARRREQMMQNALAQFAQDPTSQQGVNALLQVDPRLGIQVMGQQRQAVEAQTERADAQAKQQREFFGRLAQAADTPQAWDAIIDHYTAQFPELAQYKGRFDPNLRAGLMAEAGLTDAPDRQTAMQQNYEFLRSQNPQLAEAYLRNQAEGAPMIASNGDGTFTIIPRNYATAPAPQAPRPVATPQEYQALPPGTEYIAPDGTRRVKGGATASPSPTFPQP